MEELIKKFEEVLLLTSDRTNFESLELKDDTVTIWYQNGQYKNLSIACDSKLAAIKDIVEKI